MLRILSSLNVIDVFAIRLKSFANALCRALKKLWVVNKANL